MKTIKPFNALFEEYLLNQNMMWAKWGDSEFDVKLMRFYGPQGFF